MFLVRYSLVTINLPTPTSTLHGWEFILQKNSIANITEKDYIIINYFDYFIIIY
jgi:hypothetical protein